MTALDPGDFAHDDEQRHADHENPEAVLTLCWRHDLEHREYVCTCNPPVVGDTGREP